MRGDRKESKMKKFWQAIFGNMPLKVLALFLAVVLYIVINLPV